MHQYVHSLLFSLILLALPNVTMAQEISESSREQFIAEQDVYLQELGLSIDQRKAYQQITIDYEKLFQALESSTMPAATKKKRRKQIRKAKDDDMKKVLRSDQFKRYLQRQKEIEKKYL